MNFIYNENNEIIGFKSRVYDDLYLPNKAEDTLSGFVLDYSKYDFDSTDAIDKYLEELEKELYSKNSFFVKALCTDESIAYCRYKVSLLPYFYYTNNVKPRSKAIIKELIKCLNMFDLNDWGTTKNDYDYQEEIDYFKEHIQDIFSGKILVYTCNDL